MILDLGGVRPSLIVADRPARSTIVSMFNVMKAKPSFSAPLSIFLRRSQCQGGGSFVAKATMIHRILRILGSYRNFRTLRQD